MGNAPETTSAQMALRLAYLRLIFGVLQVVGATASLVLLLETGLNTTSAAAVAITGLVSLTSRLIFRKPKSSKP